MEGRRGSKVEMLTRYSISTSDSTTRTSFALTFRLLAATQHPVQRRPAGQSPTTVIQRRVDGAPGFPRCLWYWLGRVRWPLPRPLVIGFWPGQDLLHRKVGQRLAIPHSPVPRQKTGQRAGSLKSARSWDKGRVHRVAGLVRCFRYQPRRRDARRATRKEGRVKLLLALPPRVRASARGRWA